MLREKFCAVLENSSREDLLSLWVSLSYNLTVTGRNTYKSGTDEVENPKVLRGINEMQNKITSHLKKICKNNFLADHFDVISKIFELAELYDATYELEAALSFSLENV